MPPLLLGHRGARASQHIPENSLESFELCLQHGCDGFEFDVRLTSDGQPVICHDAISRSLKVESSTSAALGLPTLDKVLKQFSDRAFLDVELKVAGLEKITLQTLAKHPPQRGYVVSSFLSEVLISIYALDPAIPLGYLCDTRKKLRGWREFPAKWVIPRCDLTDEVLIQQIHDAGRQAMVWTVNRPADMRALHNWGVDAIISDETERLINVSRHKVSLHKVSRHKVSRHK